MKGKDIIYFFSKGRWFYFIVGFVIFEAFMKQLIDASFIFGIILGFLCGIGDFIISYHYGKGIMALIGEYFD